MGWGSATKRFIQIFTLRVQSYISPNSDSNMYPTQEALSFYVFAQLLDKTSTIKKKSMKSFMML